MKCTRVGLSVIALLSLVAVEAALADCPTNTIKAAYTNDPARTTSAPRDTASKYDSGSYCTDYCVHWYLDADATYDLVAGTMSAGVLASGAALGEASVSTHDVFTLLGPAAAPPIAFHARASVLVASGCGYGPDASADASIRGETSASASVGGGMWQNCGGPRQNLDISITRAAGSTFDLYLSVHAAAGANRCPSCSAGGDAHSDLALSFPDLPPGYSVVSCQGYAAGQVTAAQRLTWGELKAHYR